VFWDISASPAFFLGLSGKKMKIEQSEIKVLRVSSTIQRRTTTMGQMWSFTSQGKSNRGL
jgi:hypothetical protein